MSGEHSSYPKDKIKHPSLCLVNENGVITMLLKSGVNRSVNPLSVNVCKGRLSPRSAVWKSPECKMLKFQMETDRKIITFNLNR